MRSDIYRRIVFLIDEHHTWIKVDNANQYDVCDVKLAERRVPCVCRTLALRSLFRYGQYPKGSIWQIPERELDLALNKLRKNNKGFAKRLKQGAEHTVIVMSTLLYNLLLTASSILNSPIIDIATFQTINYDMDFSSIGFPVTASHCTNRVVQKQ